MSWGLKFDGANDYMSFTALASTNASSNIDWSIESLVKGASGSVFILGSNSINEGVILRSNGNVDYRYNGGTTETFAAAVSDATVYNKIEFDMLWTGGSRILTLTVNDVVFASRTIARASVPPYNTSGKIQTNFANAEIQYVKYTDNNNSSNNRDYDSTSSNHAAGAVVWSDISGNAVNATGVSFPTDGSAWVDLGGSGVSLSVDDTILKPVFSIQSAVTLPAKVSLIDFIISKPVFNSSASVTLPQPVSGVSVLIQGPSFSSSINVTLPDSISDISVNLGGPVFSVSAGVTLPNPDSSVSVLMGKPLFSASVVITEPLNDSSIGLLIDKPVFSAQGSITLPQPISSVQFNINKPVFSVGMGVTGLDIIVGDNATITISFESNLVIDTTESNTIILEIQSNKLKV